MLEPASTTLTFLGNTRLQTWNLSDVRDVFQWKMWVEIINLRSGNAQKHYSVFNYRKSGSNKQQRQYFL